MEQFLMETFGFSQFLGIQKLIIQAILNERDVFAICPTSAGKSLCYQFPALFLKKCFFIISPLLALIADQIRDLKEKFNINVFSYSSDVDEKDKVNMINSLMADQLDTFLVYITMESIHSERMRPVIEKLIAKNQFGGFVFDEAHTTVESKYRLAYEKAAMRQYFPGTYTISAFTASANPAMQAAIRQKLGIVRNDAFFTQLLYRPNITPFFSKVEPPKRMDTMVEWLKQKYGDVLPNGIIYCNKKDTCTTIAESLELIFKNEFVVYHGGMGKDVREEIYTKFRANNVVAVANDAFGMGINKSNIRFVFQYDPPKSINGLYQAMGRAGRDGKQSYYVMFANSKIVNVIGMMFKDNPPENLTTMRKVCSAAMDWCCTWRRILTYLSLSEAVKMKCSGEFEKCSVCRGESLPPPSAKTPRSKPKPKISKPKRNSKK